MGGFQSGFADPNPVRGRHHFRYRHGRRRAGRVQHLGGELSAAGGHPIPSGLPPPALQRRQARNRNRDGGRARPHGGLDHCARQRPAVRLQPCVLDAGGDWRDRPECRPGRLGHLGRIYRRRRPRLRDRCAGDPERLEHRLCPSRPDGAVSAAGAAGELDQRGEPIPSERRLRGLGLSVQPRSRNAAGHCQSPDGPLPIHFFPCHPVAPTGPQGRRFGRGNVLDRRAAKHLGGELGELLEPRQGGVHDDLGGGCRLRAGPHLPCTGQSHRLSEGAGSAVCQQLLGAASRADTGPAAGQRRQRHGLFGLHREPQ